MVANFTYKWYEHKPESVQQNEVHKILWNFKIQINHLIPTRIPDVVVINKKKRRICCLVDFAVPVDDLIKIKRTRKD